MKQVKTLVGAVLALSFLTGAVANAQTVHLKSVDRGLVVQEEDTVEPLTYADTTCYLFTPSNGALPFVRYRAFINFNQVGVRDVFFFAASGEPYEKWLALRRIECRAEAEDLCGLSGNPEIGTFNSVTIANNILGTPTLIHQCSN